MSVAVERELEQADVTCPQCPLCAVPMWLLKIVHPVGGDASDRLHFKCMECDAEAIIPSLDG